MFFLGLTCGMILMLAIVLLTGSDAPDQSAPAPPKQSIHEIEREAIRGMVATAMISGRIGKDPAVDGTGTQPGADSS